MDLKKFMAINRNAIRGYIRKANGHQLPRVRQRLSAMDSAQIIAETGHVAEIFISPEVEIGEKWLVVCLRGDELSSILAKNEGWHLSSSLHAVYRYVPAQQAKSFISIGQVYLKSDTSLSVEAWNLPPGKQLTEVVDGLYIGTDSNGARMLRKVS